MITTAAAPCRLRRDARSSVSPTCRALSVNDRLGVSGLKRAPRRAGSGHASRETDAIARPPPRAGNGSDATRATGASGLKPVDTNPCSRLGMGNGDHAMISVVATSPAFVGLRKERAR